MEKPVEVKIVGLDESDIKTVLEKLGKLADNLNNFFEMSFTQSGRLKVSVIPIPVGDTKELTKEMVESLKELPDLIKELIQEIRELKETIKAEKRKESENK
jgi:hypothetical protein